MSESIKINFGLVLSSLDSNTSCSIVVLLKTLVPYNVKDYTMIVEVFLALDDTKMEDTSKVVDISSLQQEEAKGGGIAWHSLDFKLE